MGRMWRRRIQLDELVETHYRVSPRDCDPVGGPPANRAIDFNDFTSVLLDGVRVEIVRVARGRTRGGNRRLFVCPRCGKPHWYVYLPGVACMRCLGLRYASRHHLVNEQTWSGPTQRLPNGQKRRRKVVHFRHFKRRSYSQAGWKR